MALSANKARKYQGDPVRVLGYPIDGNFSPYVGAAMMLNLTSGGATYAAQGVAANIRFLGFLLESKDNRAASGIQGVGETGQVLCDIAVQGFVHLNITKTGGWAYTDHGALIYATDNDTFVVGLAGTDPSSNLLVGRVARVPDYSVGVITLAEILVYFEASFMRSLGPNAP